MSPPSQGFAFAWNSQGDDGTGAERCPGGGTGRHARFRVWWWQHRGGSSPLLGTADSKFDDRSFPFANENAPGAVWLSKVPKALSVENAAASCHPRPNTRAAHAATAKEVPVAAAIPNVL